MPIIFRYSFAAFFCLIITDASATAELNPVASESASLASDDIREIRITNGQQINPREYPFLSAVLTGRRADVQIGVDQTNAYFFGGIEPVQFLGPVFECGLALQPCLGASGRVCSIVLDFPSEDLAVISPAQQIENCRLGGGTGAILRTGTGGGSVDLEGVRPAIPAVYLSDFEGKQKLLNALMFGEEFTVNVVPGVPDEILCGGTYLGGRWVLTAAHCVTDDSGSQRRIVEPFELLVNVAAHDLAGEKNSAQQVAEIVTDNYYTNGPWGVNDYALLRLDAVPEGGEPVALISRDELTSLAAAAAPAQVVGWGSTKVREPLEPIDFYSSVTSNYPLLATLTLHTVDSCANLWRDFLLLNNLDPAGLTINQNHVCASNVEFQRDTCQGDSGGPLLVTSEGKLKLAGITSFGLGCGSANSVPGVYASVPSYTGWISNVTGLKQPESPEGPNRSSNGLSNADSLTDVQVGGAGLFQIPVFATIFVLSVFRRRRGR